jgi:hypothetical protein
MSEDRITARSSDPVDPRLVRGFIRHALAHDAVSDPVHDLLDDHVTAARNDPNVIAASLKRLLSNTLTAATALDWHVVSDELIADVREALSPEPAATGLTIDREQREAIHPHLLLDLTTAVGEVYVALGHDDWATARARRCRIEQDMRLLDDIGWNTEDPGGRFALTIPHETLLPTIERLHAAADALTRELLLDVLDGAGLQVLHAQEPSPRSSTRFRATRVRLTVTDGRAVRSRSRPGALSRTVAPSTGALDQAGTASLRPSPPTSLPGCSSPTSPQYGPPPQLIPSVGREQTAVEPARLAFGLRGRARPACR